jgi:hypothetical protein
LGPRSGCKRIRRMKDGTDAELQKVRLTLQYWCSLAHTASRQRHHIRLPLDAVPVAVVVEAARIDNGPAEPVKIDAELDQIDEDQQACQM